MINFLNNQNSNHKTQIMKRTTKTLIAVLLMFTGSIVFTACQEEVYPDLQTPELTDSISPSDTGSETDDEEKDEGMNPK